MSVVRCDLCVIGGGSAGLSLAAVASQMGATVVLFEGHRMGGDCLNSGCIPSKTLLAEARRGQNSADPRVRYREAKATVRNAIQAIEPHDSVARFEGLGVRVVSAEAQFVGPRTVEGGGLTVVGRRVAIATGSRPRIPDIKGLEALDYWTTDTLFEQDEWPAELVILGGGAIGFEMAQAHVRLGSSVTVIEPNRLLARDEPTLVSGLRASLEAEGVRFLVGQPVTEVSREANGRVTLTLANGDAVVGDRVLVASGRQPNIERLNLDAAGVRANASGIVTDNRLRTTARGVFAIGDVAGRYALTHVASAHAGVVLKQSLFGWPARISSRPPPWVIYTDPELAHAGLTHTERDQNISLAQQRVYRWPFSELDRAVCEGRTEGEIRVVTDPKGHILSVDILGQHAGELLAPWILAMEQKLPLSALANLGIPYPTRSEISKRVAGSVYTPRLYSGKMKRLVRWLQRWMP